MQLHTEYSSRLLEASSELERLTEERRLRRRLVAQGQELLTLDVGGKVFQVKRETLCQCQGSFLAELFSGRRGGEVK